MSGKDRDHVIKCLEIAKGDPNVAFELSQITAEQLTAMTQNAMGMGMGMDGMDGMEDDDDYGDEG